MTIEYTEAYIPPEEYAQLIGMDDAPDLAEFPDGIFILGTKDFAEIIGYYAESQIDKMKQLEILGH